MTRPALWDSIAHSIRLQQKQQKSVWLVVHFEDTFVECQSLLESRNIDYMVQTLPPSAAWFKEHRSDTGRLVRLWLADLLQPFDEESQPAIDSPMPIAMMVSERHPYGPKDDQLMDVARSLPANVEVGYFMALDDALVRRLVPDQLIDLMKTMGLNDHELISSTLITKRLDRVIRRQIVGSRPAEQATSAAQWFDLQNDSQRR